ncbi:hypothetical protein FNF27_02911 [Cafeteria roenbergensis]|uniref:FHA domain-containing protein n=1 Tax=Cafeteria roenbergensis TaxID=33653 RepID=A0A5A8EHV8_CAFRO|nr:hypothetical protein FNF27_02911 [Cafeteria roenbergensis]
MAEAAKFSDDSKLLVYIERGAGGSGLVALHTESGATATLISGAMAAKHGSARTRAAELLRERRRVPKDGLSDFSWVPGCRSIIVPLGAAILNIDAGAAVEGGDHQLSDVVWPVLEVGSLAAPIPFPAGAPSSAGDEADALATALPAPCAGAEPIDVKPSPCGRLVGFVLDDELCIARADGTGPVVQLTSGARGVDGLSNATSDFLSAEEFDRYEAWWWAPDSRSVLLQRSDERGVTRVVFARQTEPDPEDEAGATEAHRYPFTGGRNPSITLEVLSIGDAVSALLGDGPADAAPLPVWPAAALAGHAPGPAPAGFAPPSVRAPVSRSTAPGPRPTLTLHGSWRRRPLALGPKQADGVSPADVYLADAGFAPDGSVFAQVVSRDHSRLDLVRFCPRSGRAELLVREAAPGSWVNTDKLLTWVRLTGSTPATASPAGAASAAGGGKAGAGAFCSVPGRSPSVTDTPPVTPSKGSSLAGQPAASFPFTGGRARERLYFVWASERSGFRHLYLYAARRAFSFDADLTIAKARAAAAGDDVSAVGREDEDGIPTGPGDPRLVVLSNSAESEATLRRPLTGGEWVVLDSGPMCGNGRGVAVCPDTHSVFFAANAASPMEQHVYRAPLPVQRTAAAGSVTPGSSTATPASPMPSMSPSAANTWSPGAAASSPRRSLRPRVGALLAEGDVGEDMYSWGLTLGTYAVSQVTPGDRGVCRMVLSPDCTTAVMTHSRLSRSQGSPATEVVRIRFPDGLSRSSPVPGGGAAGDGGASPVKLSSPPGTARRSARSPPRTGAASPVKSRGQDIEEAATAGSEVGDAGGASPSKRDAAAVVGAAGGAKAPPLSFALSAPCVASSMGFMAGTRDATSPSGFGLTVLVGLSGETEPLVPPQPAPPADAGSAASAGSLAAAAPGSPQPQSPPLDPELHAFLSPTVPRRIPAGDGAIMFACPAADGVTTLFGCLQLPTASPARSGPPPAVLRVYGGPHVQLVCDNRMALGAGAISGLRAAGAAVFTVDGRGSYNRGKRFETATRCRFGLTDVADQLAATRFLVDRGLVDPSRLGVMGWSYGGFMTLMLMAKSAPVEAMLPPPAAAQGGDGSEPAELSGSPALRRSHSGSGFVSCPPVCFRAGVAGGPVTEWENYDTAYTERYMSTPSKEPEAYARGSVVKHVEGLRGKAALLIHGSLDENVLPRNTQRVVARALQLGIDIDAFFLPDSRHGPGSAGAGKAVVTKSLQHFKRHLSLE